MDYYHFVRSEIKPLLPKAPTRILDVGAGAGATLRWLKTLNPNTEMTAVELNPALVDELKQHANVVVVGPIDESISQLKTYDLILLLDVLEHLPELNRHPSKAHQAAGARRSGHCFRPQCRSFERFHSTSATPV